MRPPGSLGSRRLPRLCEDGQHSVSLVFATMDEATRIARAAAFDGVAADYDAVRPGYPPQLFQNVIAFADVTTASRILEVGCGTGQATEPFSDCRSTITCLEPSSALASFARHRFQGHQRIEIITGRFEDTPLASRSYDLLFAATAFHWLDPAVRFERSADLLKPGGTLAIFANIHPRPFTGFFADVQRFYRELGPEWGNPDTSATTDDHIDQGLRELAEHSSFTTAVSQSYKWSRTYTSQEYSRLLATYSDHVRLGPTKLGKLQNDIRHLIDSNHGGTITRPYETLLCMAKRI